MKAEASNVSLLNSTAHIIEPPRANDLPQDDFTVGMRIAVVHEWLSTLGGSEQALGHILSLYPRADLFAVVDFLPPEKREFLGGRTAKVSFIQNLPLARKNFRWYLPLMPVAMEQLDLSHYDLVISSSHAVSKGVLTNCNQIHLSYVYSPIRYAWDLQEQYLDRSAGMGIVKSVAARALMHYLRLWDIRTSSGVDRFIAVSNFVAGRIMKTYRRLAIVIYPPVDVAKFELVRKKENYYVTVSRLVSYKHVDLLLAAFAQMPERQLIVIGEGPEFIRLRRSAPPNVCMMGNLGNREMRRYLGNARAFLFAGEEDFGLVMVEAQACGTPVIAFGRGGATEIVIEGRNGLLFAEQTPEAICSAVNDFERNCRFDPIQVRRSAMRFDGVRFRSEFRTAVNDAIVEHRSFGLALRPLLEN